MLWTKLRLFLLGQVNSLEATDEDLEGVSLDIRSHICISGLFALLLDDYLFICINGLFALLLDAYLFIWYVVFFRVLSYISLLP